MEHRALATPSAHKEHQHHAEHYHCGCDRQGRPVGRFECESGRVERHSAVCNSTIGVFYL